MADSNDNNADSLVDEGLQLYSQGQLDRAIVLWNDALSIDPEHGRARDYIKYVEDNRTALEASFKSIEEVEPAEEAPGAEGEEAPAAEGEEHAAPEGQLEGDEAAERVRRILEEADPKQTLPLPGIEPTVRMDANVLKSKVDRTKNTRPTPRRPAPAVVEPVDRSRRATPLVVVAGAGEADEGGFEPQEQTPVGIGLPRPHIAVSAGPEFDRGHKTPVVEPPPDLFEEDSGPTPAPTVGEPGDRVASMLAGARQLHEQGTLEGSLWLCERVLGLEPENVEARELLEHNRRLLLEQNRKQIGDATQVPLVQIPQHEIMWHKLDHRAGFLLSRIDGQLSYEDIIDVSGMGEFEASRILAQLISMGVISTKR